MGGVKYFLRDTGEQTRSGTSKARQTIDSYRYFFELNIRFEDEVISYSFPSKHGVYILGAPYMLNECVIFDELGCAPHPKVGSKESPHTI